MKMVWLLGFELSCGLESRLESCQQLWAFGVEGKKISNESWEIKEKFRPIQANIQVPQTLNNSISYIQLKVYSNSNKEV